MKILITKKDIIWSYLGYILNAGSNLFILPLVLKLLSTEEIGIWYIFVAIWSFVQLLDTGFSPTIMRNISYAYSGATTILKNGIDEKQNFLGEPNCEFLVELINVSQRIYRYIAGVAIILLLSIGTIYLYFITRQNSFETPILAWVIFILAMFLNLYYTYWIPVLTGIGGIKESQKAQIVSKIFYLAVSALGLLLGYGIAAMSLGFLVGGLSLRIISKYYFMKLQDFNYLSIANGKTCFSNSISKTFGIIWHNAYKLGLVNLGAFLILQANTLIISFVTDLSTTASYGLTLQLYSAVTVFSGIMFRSYLPVISEARIHNDTATLKKYLSLTSLVGWISFGVGILGVFLIGELFSLTAIQTKLLPLPMVVFMGIYLFLEFNHTVFSTFITTNNEVPFVKAALFSGIAIVIFSYWLGSNIGIWGVLFSQALVQLVYNNWKWPIVVFNQLNFGLLDLLRIGLAELKNVKLRGQT